jgi:hypothetical protein
MAKVLVTLYGKCDNDIVFWMPIKPMKTKRIKSIKQRTLRSVSEQRGDDEKSVDSNI